MLFQKSESASKTWVKTAVLSIYSEEGSIRVLNWCWEPDLSSPYSWSAPRFCSLTLRQGQHPSSPRLTYLHKECRSTSMARKPIPGVFQQERPVGGHRQEAIHHWWLTGTTIQKSGVWICLILSWSAVEELPFTVHTRPANLGVQPHMAASDCTLPMPPNFTASSVNTANRAHESSSASNCFGFQRDSSGSS